MKKFRELFEDDYHSIKKISKLIGLRDEATKRFVTDNNINANELIQALKQKKISSSDVLAAVAGNNNNKYQKDVIKRFKNNEKI